MRNDAIQKDIIEENIAMDRRLKDIESVGWEGVKGYVRPCIAPSRWEIMSAEGMSLLARSDFLDLAVYYYIRLENRRESGASVAWVNRGALEDWGISIETLHVQAIKNMSKDGYFIQPIEDILNSLLGGALPLENAEGLSVYAFTNRTIVLGRPESWTKPDLVPLQKKRKRTCALSLPACTKRCFALALIRRMRKT